MKIALRNTLMAGTAALSVLALASCRQKEQKNETANVNIELTQLQVADSIDVTKPNLPTVGQNYVHYKGLDGKQNVVKTIYYMPEITKSLYNAVAKASTPEKPDIEDVESFYIDVEKNIPKSNIIYSTYMLTPLQASNLFKNLFEMFTSPESEKGKTITVKEYTQMMDAWSSVSDRDY